MAVISECWEAGFAVYCIHIFKMYAKIQAATSNLFCIKALKYSRTPECAPSFCKKKQTKKKQPFCCKLPCSRFKQGFSAWHFPPGFLWMSAHLCVVAAQRSTVTQASIISSSSAREAARWRTATKPVLFCASWAQGRVLIFSSPWPHW